MQRENHLLYVAFGGQDYYNEVLWSLFSLYHCSPNPNCTVHIFTDQVDYLQPQLPPEIQFHALTPEQITAWKGVHNYPYRVKIKVLQHCLQTYSGQWLYVDTDVVFRQPLSTLFEAIAQGTVWMDANEGPLHKNKGGIARKMRYLLQQQNTFTLPDGTGVTLDTQFEVWNSGCIGVTAANLPQLQRAEALMDVLYARYPLFSMEQIAVTEAFSTFPLQEAKPILHHYWYFKEFRPVIHAFLQHYSSWQERLAYAPQWDPWVLSEGKRQYKRKGFWGRTLQKIRYGYRWKNPVFLP
ncbi:MAG: hypothetical protein RL607_2314 [Bacteroidota bacterium]|jgi:hypothetical protein